MPRFAVLAMALNWLGLISGETSRQRKQSDSRLHIPWIGRSVKEQNKKHFTKQDSKFFRWWGIFMFQFYPRPQYSRLSLSFLANWIFFRVPPTLWITWVYCIWTVINITSYYVIMNGFNVVLYNLDMAKSQQEFGIYLKGTYLTYWRARLSKMRHQVLLQQVVTWRWSTEDNIQSAG